MITLICGPMYSGKSTALFQRLERCLYAKKKVLLIRPRKDDRGYFTHSGGIDLKALEEKFDKFVILTVKELELSDCESIKKDGFDDVFVDEYFMIPGASSLCHQNYFNVYYGGLLASSECELFEETKKIPWEEYLPKNARFWVAADYYLKAKEADASLKGEADAQLASVARYYPEASEMFMYDLSAGQGYDVSCGGMSARTTVRTRN